jgi:electron transport complex protein RnfG
MKKSKSFINMVKLGFILALFTPVACLVVALIYSLTSEIISKRQQNDMENALHELFPDADSFIPLEGITSPDRNVSIEGDRNNPANTGAFEAIKNGESLGLALRTSRGGWQGDAIRLLVGVGADGKITGIKILEHSETPGLGAKAARPQFYGQFAGKPVSDPFVVNQDVDAITAATLTSTAVSDSVKAAGLAALSWMNSRGGDE